MNHDEGTKWRTSKRDNERGDRYGRKSSRSSGETLIEDRVPSRNLRARIRSAENPMLNLTSRTFQVAVKRIRYARSWPVEYIGKSLKFFFFIEKKNVGIEEKKTRRWLYINIYIYILDSIYSILDSWRGEWNFVNLAKIVRHFLYIFYRVCRGRQRKESFLSWKLLHRVEKDWFFGGYIIERDNSINSSRVLEASLWRARLLARLENRVEREQPDYHGREIYDYNDPVLRPIVHHSCTMYRNSIYYRTNGNKW